MARQYNFHATEAQFEYHVRKWGCRKNKTSRTWTDLAIKVAKRKREDKPSAVFCGGERIPDAVAKKEMSRHTQLSTITQALNAPTPQTPPGYTVFTPGGSGDPEYNALARHDFGASSPLAEFSANPPDPTRSSLNVKSPLDEAHAFHVSSSKPLSPSSSSVIQIHDDQVFLLHPQDSDELDQLAEECRIEEYILRLRQWESAGCSKEVLNMWIRLIRKLYKSLNP